MGNNKNDRPVLEPCGTETWQRHYKFSADDNYSALITIDYFPSHRFDVRYNVFDGLTLIDLGGEYNHAPTPYEAVDKATDALVRYIEKKEELANG